LKKRPRDENVQGTIVQRHKGTRASGEGGEAGGGKPKVEKGLPASKRTKKKRNKQSTRNGSLSSTAGNHKKEKKNPKQKTKNKTPQTTTPASNQFVNRNQTHQSEDAKKSLLQ